METLLTVSTVFSNSNLNSVIVQLQNIQTVKNAQRKHSTLLTKSQRCKLHVTYALYTTVTADLLNVCGRYRPVDNADLACG